MQQGSATTATIYLAAAVIVALPSSASAEMAGGMFMGHNGSTIQEFSELNSDKVEYRYSSVRAGIPIQEGAVLFRGTKAKRGQHRGIAYLLKGTAFVFKRGCPPAAYEVTGEQTNSRVLLKGAAPVHAKDSCKVVSHDAQHKNATLVFDIAE